MKKFKFYNGQFIDNLDKYIETYLKKYPDIEIYIGTDSVDRGKSIYVTTICFRHPYNGAHVIYKKEIEPKSKNLFTKLWKEVEKTNEVAKFVKPIIGNKILILDLDLNSLKQYASSIAHDSAKGYLIGLGYNVRTKPQAYAAIAADHLLK